MSAPKYPMTMRNVGIAGALFCIALAIVLAISMSKKSPGTSVADLIGTPLDPPKAAADALLRDGRDRPTHVIDGIATTTMIFFGYTHCPDVCPLALAALGHAYRMLGPDARARTRIVFVTVDPARDTPAIAGRYAHQFDPHIVGLSGDPQTLAHLRDAYGVTIDARTHEIGHGATVFAVDRDARVLAVYPPDTSAKDYAHDLALLAA